jgi:hypothetical protein
LQLDWESLPVTAVQDTEYDLPDTAMPEHRAVTNITNYDQSNTVSNPDLCNRPFTIEHSIESLLFDSESLTRLETFDRVF